MSKAWKRKLDEIYFFLRLYLRSKPLLLERVVFSWQFSDTEKAIRMTECRKKMRHKTNNNFADTHKLDPFFSLFFCRCPLYEEWTHEELLLGFDDRKGKKNGTRVITQKDRGYLLCNVVVVV